MVESIVKSSLDSEDVVRCVTFLFSVDKKTVTFDVHSQRPETGEKSTLNTADGTPLDDTMTVTSGKEPSVKSCSSHSFQTSFISLEPTEQVML